MARLIYSAIASLDGYVADEDGRREVAIWSRPEAERRAVAGVRLAALRGGNRALELLGRPAVDPALDEGEHVHGMVALGFGLMLIFAMCKLLRMARRGSSSRRIS